MKNFMKICLLTLILGFTSCNQDSDINSFDDSDSFDQLANKGANKSTSMVYEPAPLGDPSVSLGTSQLVRNKNGISVVYKTWNLIPGHAYSLWVLVINEPSECDGPCGIDDVFPGDASGVSPDVLFIDGLVAGDDGKGTFSGRLNENDDSTSANKYVGLPTDVGGMWDAETAEIHLVLRSHGPAIPGMELAQTTTFTGGCTSSTGLFQAIPMVEGACGQIQASVHVAN